MRGLPILTLVLLAALLAPALADTSGTTHTRTVERLVATPTPLGPVTVLDDGHVWEVDVPAGAQVFVKAKGAPGSLFYLRWHGPVSPYPPPLAAPAAEDGATLPPGVWRVTVDPAGGAAVTVAVTFAGHHGDLGGPPASFTVRDVSGGNPCVVPGACLP